MVTLNPSLILQLAKAQNLNDVSRLDASNKDITEVSCMHVWRLATGATPPLPTLASYLPHRRLPTWP
jgi:hypothetical protein